LKTDHCVTLELTGPLERTVGKCEVNVYVRDTAPLPLGEVVGQFVREHPAAASLIADAAFFEQTQGCFPPGLLVIRNSVAIAAKIETTVAAGERLTLMPIISGG